jgi:hypothetical protein
MSTNNALPEPSGSVEELNEAKRQLVRHWSFRATSTTSEAMAALDAYASAVRAQQAAQIALYKKKAQDWNAEADRYLAQRDKLQLRAEAAEAEIERMLIAARNEFTRAEAAEARVTKQAAQIAHERQQRMQNLQDALSWKARAEAAEAEIERLKAEQQVIADHLEAEDRGDGAGWIAPGFEPPIEGDDEKFSTLVVQVIDALHRIADKSDDRAEALEARLAHQETGPPVFDPTALTAQERSAINEITTVEPRTSEEP